MFYIIEILNFELITYLQSKHLARQNIAKKG